MAKKEKVAEVPVAEMEAALKAIADIPGEIKNLEDELSEARAFVGRNSPKERQASLADCNTQFQQGVKDDIAAKSGLKE